MARSAAEFAALEGSNDAGGTEQNAECTFHTTPTMQAVFASVSSAATAGNLTFRRNGADESALQVSVTATGLVEDLVGSVTMADGDEGNWGLVITTGTVNIRMTGIEADDTPAAAPSLVFKNRAAERALLAA